MASTAVCAKLVVGLTVGALLALQMPALAQPREPGRGEARARQLEEGGAIESIVEVRPLPLPSRDNPGGVRSATNRYAYYWRDAVMPAGTPRCPTGPYQEQVRYDRITGTETVVSGAECRGPDFSDRFAALPAPPPPAPTLDEIRDLVEAKITAQPITVSPDWGGVTGLESWFWYEGPREVTVTATIRGYRTTATMGPTAFIWNPCAAYTPPRDASHSKPIGCRTVSSSHPGSEPPPDSNGQQAAASFLYETKGIYELAMTVVWEGEWTFVGNGASAEGDLSTIRVTSTRTYSVSEIRSQLTDTG